MTGIAIITEARIGVKRGACVDLTIAVVVVQSLLRGTTTISSSNHANCQWP